MSLLRYYNLTKGVAAFPGATGTLASGTAKTVFIEEIDQDVDITSLALKGPTMGLAMHSVDVSTLLPEFAGGTQRSAGLLSSASLDSAVRTAVIIGNGAVATLMAAAAVPVNTHVRVFIDAGFGASTASVARAGADTIDGGADPINLTVSAPLVTLRSDGVSAWVTV